MAVMESPSASTGLSGLPMVIAIYLSPSTPIVRMLAVLSVCIRSMTLVLIIISTPTSFLSRSVRNHIWDTVPTSTPASLTGEPAINPPTSLKLV